MAGLEGLRGKKLHLPDPTADHGSHEEVDDSGDSGLFSCIIFVEVKKITQTRHGQKMTKFTDLMHSRCFILSKNSHN